MLWRIQANPHTIIIKFPATMKFLNPKKQKQCQNNIHPTMPSDNFASNVIFPWSYWLLLILTHITVWNVDFNWSGFNLSWEQLPGLSSISDKSGVIKFANRNWCQRIFKWHVIRQKIKYCLFPQTRPTLKNRCDSNYFIVDIEQELFFKCPLSSVLKQSIIV